VLGCSLAFAGNNDPMTITRITTDSVVGDQRLTNDCNGEDVILNGTMHFESTTGVDSDGDRTIYDLDTDEAFGWRRPDYPCSLCVSG
jgi:hypothetical protein